MSSRYSTEFKENLERVYFLRRIKLLYKNLEQDKQNQKHHCENNESGHQFQKFQPHLGCTKMVCRFCAQENPDKLFMPSIYSFRGRTFQFKKRNFSQAPTDYRCA